MNSFEKINIPHFDPEAHNERIQARLLDSVQFRLQQQINLKNDEISRLQDDLAMLKGEIETLSDTLSSKQKSTIEADSEINNQVIQAKHDAEIKIIQSKKEHSKQLQLIEQQHQEEIQSLQKTLENTIFQYSKQSKNKSKSSTFKEEDLNYEEERSSNINEEDNEIDNFLESLQTTKTKAKEKMQEVKKSKKLLTEADLEANDQKITQQKELISTLEERKKKLKSKIDQTKKNIVQIGKDIEFDINSDLEPNSNNGTSNISDDVLFNGSFDDMLDKNQFNEQTRPYFEKVQRAMKKLDDLKKKRQPVLSKLKKKIQIEQDNIKAKKQQIAEKVNENEKIQQKLIKLKQKYQEVEGKKKRERERQESQYSSTMDSKLVKALASMSSKQKEIKLQSLIMENKALKREIYRLDNMLYGKAGKYHNWKDI